MFSEKFSEELLINMLKIWNSFKWRYFTKHVCEKKLSLLAQVRFFDQFLSGASLFVCPSVHICFLIVYLSSRTTGNISTKLDTKQHWVKEVSFFCFFFLYEGSRFFQGNAICIYWYFFVIVQRIVFSKTIKPEKLYIM